MIDFKRLVDEEKMFEEQRLIIDLKRIEEPEMNIFKEHNIQIEIKESTIDVLNDGEVIVFAFLTGKMRIKSEDERDVIKEAIAKALGGSVADFSFLKNLIKELEQYMVYNAKKLVQKADFVQKLYKDPGNKPALFDLAEAMQGEFNIVGVKNGDSANYYRLNNNTYEPLDKKNYQSLVKQKYGTRLTEQDAKNSLHSLEAEAIEENHYWEFANNVYLDTKGYKIVTNQDIGYIPLTNRRFIFNDELIPYKNDVDYTNSGTLWEETLKQILIPKANPEDDRLFKRFLYLVGTAMIANNPEKFFIMYYNPTPNNGRTLLVWSLKQVFNNAFISVAVGELNNDFIYSRGDDTNVINVDEILEGSLNGLEDVLKKITAGGEPIMSPRQMFSTKRDTSKGLGMLWICCNPAPKFQYDEALYYRLQIQKLPNRFEDNPNDNQYQKDPFRQQKLSEDIEGFTWFVNACIKAKKEYKFERQTVNETMNILWESDPIRKYLIENYEPSTNSEEVLTNDDITSAMMKDDDIKNKYQTTEELAPKVGYAIKDVFGNVKSNQTYPVKYFLREK